MNNPKLVLAVSGGVDSMVMLDMLAKSHRPQSLVVAHFDHGIRPDSKKDAQLVKATCKDLKINYEQGSANLGEGASEELARLHRQSFLRDVRIRYGADNIMTAHHKDDLIETAIINLLRGTGRKGLTSLKNNDIYRRPLLGMTKKDILKYAKDNNIEWNEDSTNTDTKYLRNYIRLELIPKALQKDPDFKDKLQKMIDDLKKSNQKIDIILSSLVASSFAGSRLPRDFVRALDDEVIKELILFIARNKFNEFYLSKERLERSVDFIKNKQTGKVFEFNGRFSITLEKAVIKFEGKV